MNNIFLETKNISQSFGKGRAKIDVLKKVNLSIAEGEIVALMAPSGTGKSTLLHILGLLEKSKSGEVIINGKKTSKLSDSRRTKVRRDNIGFVYQFHNLQGEFTALENIMIPQLFAKVSKKKAKERAIELLDLVGLKNRSKHIPAKLSGGEQQRVSIARALANSPKLLLADEPTGNLDIATATEVFNMLLEAVRTENMACLFATHNEELAKKADRILRLDEISNG